MLVMKHINKNKTCLNKTKTNKLMKHKNIKVFLKFNREINDYTLM